VCCIKFKGHVAKAYVKYESLVFIDTKYLIFGIVEYIIFKRIFSYLSP
jgi:hypothetical protein